MIWSENRICCFLIWFLFSLDKRTYVLRLWKENLASVLNIFCLGYIGKLWSKHDFFMTNSQLNSSDVMEQFEMIMSKHNGTSVISRESAILICGILWCVTSCNKRAGVLLTLPEDFNTNLWDRRIYLSCMCDN